MAGFFKLKLRTYCFSEKTVVSSTRAQFLKTEERFVNLTISEKIQTGVIKEMEFPGVWKK